MQTIQTDSKTSDRISTNLNPTKDQITPAFSLEDLSAQSGIGLWKLVFDLPGEKVNKFNAQVMGEFETLLSRLEGLAQKGQIGILVLHSGKKGNFIAGADIQLIRASKTEKEAEQLSETGQKLLNRWEDLPFPTVVAINGNCLGGGCELSLASTAIVMSNHPSARIGLPETMLGIIPGMGGCVRMPTKIGIASALEMILAGKTVTGEKAYKMGLADGLIPKESFDDTVGIWVKQNFTKLKNRERIAKEPKLGGMGGMTGNVLESTPFGKSMIFSKAKEGVISKTRGKYPAPLEAIKVIQDISTGYGKRFRGRQRDEAMKREAQGFGKMAATEISKNLIRLFFLTESLKKANGLPDGKQIEVESVSRAAVLGAGVMGGGIAQLFADKQVSTRMKDINLPALTTGMQSAAKIFKKKVQRRSLTEREMIQKMNLISPTLEYSGMKQTQMVVEAVIEKMDIKKSVLKDLENHISDACVVASNTSSLSISEMQSVLRVPERFVGMHFFNPVHKMPLVEVIRGAKSSDHAVAMTFQFSKQIGKTPIVVKDAPGFLVNRLLLPYLNEAMHILSDGASIEEIDNALLDFGMPMGPVELIDEVGVDVGEKVVHILHDAFGVRMNPSAIDGKLVNAKRLGKKNGKGFYDYTIEKGKKKIDPVVYDLLGVKPRASSMPVTEIVNRCILPVINEAARCLEESVVETASDVDLGMIMGTGFPPFRGGLLRYADSIGLAQIVEQLRDLESRIGERFAPAEVLVKMASQGESFYKPE